MSWRSLGRYILNKNWQYTNPVQGEIFRIKSGLISSTSNQYLKGAISSIVMDEDRKINLFDSKRLSYRIEPEIFTFYFPIGLGDQRIGIKRLDDTNLIWTIELEVLNVDSQDYDFDKFITQFGDRILSFMSVYNRGVAFVPHTPASARIELNSREKKKILDANSKRRNLTLTNGSSLILVCDGFQENGAPKTVLYTLQPNEEYNFPVNNGLYQGEVHFMNLTESKANASYIEYNAAV